MSDKVKKLSEIGLRIDALMEQVRALEAEQSALSPTFDEWFASMVGRWRGPYAYYSDRDAGDMLHVFLEDEASVSSWHPDGLDIQYAHGDHERIVGMSIMGLRGFLKRLHEKRKVAPCDS